MDLAYLYKYEYLFIYGFISCILLVATGYFQWLSLGIYRGGVFGVSIWNRLRLNSSFVGGVLCFLVSFWCNSESQAGFNSAVGGFSEPSALTF